MKIEFLSHFDRAFKKYSLTIRQNIQKTIESFLVNLEQGKRPQGLGFRHLKGSIWEIRIGLQYRVLLELGKNRVTFLLVGNHDEVKRFLKRY